MTTPSQHIAARLAEAGVRHSTMRNGGIGFIIGSCFLALKWNKMRRNPDDLNKFKRRWFLYLAKFPLFLSTFTVLYKSLSRLGRQLAGYRGLTDQGKRRTARRTMLAVTSFICAYAAQLASPVFNWNWALYYFLRSFLGMCRLFIPTHFQPDPANAYALVHGILPFFITYNGTFISSSYAAFFAAVMDQHTKPWVGMYGVGDGKNHHHGIIPPCKRCVHGEHDQSCLNAFIKDGIKMYKLCFQFYLKFYVTTSLLGGLKFLRALMNKPTFVIPKLLSQTVRSSLFLFISFHVPSRIHCLYQWLLKVYHRKIRGDEYAPIAANNLMLMLVVSAVVGGRCLRFELSKAKQTDIALFSFWRILELAILMKGNVRSKEKDYGNPVLGNKHFPALLFALACAMSIYVYVTNPRKLKSLEKSVLDYALA